LILFGNSLLGGDPDKRNDLIDTLKEHIADPQNKVKEIAFLEVLKKQIGNLSGSVAPCHQQKKQSFKDRFYLFTEGLLGGSACEEGGARARDADQFLEEPEGSGGAEGGGASEEVANLGDRIYGHMPYPDEFLEGLFFRLGGMIEQLSSGRPESETASEIHTAATAIQRLVKGRRARSDLIRNEAGKKICVFFKGLDLENIRDKNAARIASESVSFNMGS
jgi:hypothetical protein